MNSIFKFFVMTLFSFALMGCVTLMTKEEVATAKFEQLPSSYKSDIEKFISANLKDPDSAKYIFHDPRKGYQSSKKLVAMVVPVEVNGKNSYGGYTGYTLYHIAYISGQYQDVTTGVMYEVIKFAD